MALSGIIRMAEAGGSTAGARIAAYGATLSPERVPTKGRAMASGAIAPTADLCRRIFSGQQEVAVPSLPSRNLRGSDSEQGGHPAAVSGCLVCDFPDAVDSQQIVKVDPLVRTTAGNLELHSGSISYSGHRDKASHRTQAWRRCPSLESFGN